MGTGIIVYSYTNLTTLFYLCNSQPHSVLAHIATLSSGTVDLRSRAMTSSVVTAFFESLVRFGTPGDPTATAAAAEHLSTSNTQVVHAKTEETAVVVESYAR